VVSVELDTGEYAILTADGMSTQVLATASDPRQPGGPFDVLTLPFVVGDRIVILGTTIDGAEETILYTDAAGFAPFFADEVDRRVEDATAGGRALVEQFGERVLAQFLMSPDGSLSQIVEYRSLADPRAVAINDRDNVLFITEGTVLGTRRHSLSITGPAPSGGCPRAPTPETPQPTPTSSPTETPTPTSTPTHPLVPSSTPTPTHATPVRTEPPTQPTVPSATVAPSSPTAVAHPLEFSDGCQTVPPRRTQAWVLMLPVFAVLVRGLGRRRSG
jgi:hypothetical protein